MLAIAFLIGGALALTVPPLFSDHMVLQRHDDERGVPATHFFGTANLTETVHINGSDGFPGPFKVMPSTLVPDTTVGNWSVEVRAPDKPGPYSVTIMSTNSSGSVVASVTFQDVYFGEVFLCGGQSNMELEVRQTDNASLEYSYAPQMPTIRMFMVLHNSSAVPLQTLASRHGPWEIPSEDSVSDYSAVCWTQGRMLHQWFEKMGKPTPIGLIQSTMGGTTVHFWAQGHTGEVCNKTGMLPSTGEAVGNVAGALFNAMINPVGMNGTGLSVRAATYYQGEADAGENDVYSQDAYMCELSGLIYSWRMTFGQPNLPFVIIQLPGSKTTIGPYGNDDGEYQLWDGIRVAQNRVFGMVNNTGLVQTNDQGCCNLHYGHKIEVARRASLWVRSLAFGDTTVNPSGPRFISATKDSAGSLEVRIKVWNAGSTGLKFIPSWLCRTSQGQTVYTDKAYQYTCCDGGGVSTVKLRLRGVYWSYEPKIALAPDDGPRLGFHGPYDSLWNWMPANVTLDNDVIIARPILPVDHLQIWNHYECSETMRVDAVSIQTNSLCSIASSDGLPMSLTGPWGVSVVPNSMV